MSRTFQDVRLERTESRFNMAKFVHDQLENELTANENEDKERRTFFDRGITKKKAEKEEEDDEKKEDGEPIWKSLLENADVRLSSLDFTVYAALKEEITNTPDSDEVKYLQSSCPQLLKFYKLMEAMFDSKLPMNPTETQANEEFNTSKQMFKAAN